MQIPSTIFQANKDTTKKYNDVDLKQTMVAYKEGSELKQINLIDFLTKKPFSVDAFNALDIEIHGYGGFKDVLKSKIDDLTQAIYDLNSKTLFIIPTWIDAKRILKGKPKNFDSQFVALLNNILSFFKITKIYTTGESLGSTGLIDIYNKIDKTRVKEYSINIYSPPKSIVKMVGGHANLTQKLAELKESIKKNKPNHYLEVNIEATEGFDFIHKNKNEIKKYKQIIDNIHFVQKIPKNIKFQDHTKDKSRSDVLIDSKKTLSIPTKEKLINQEVDTLYEQVLDKLKAKFLKSEKDFKIAFIMFDAMLDFQNDKNNQDFIESLKRVGWSELKTNDSFKNLLIEKLRKSMFGDLANNLENNLIDDWNYLNKISKTVQKACKELNFGTTENRIYVINGKKVENQGSSSKRVADFLGTNFVKHTLKEIMKNTFKEVN